MRTPAGARVLVGVCNGFGVLLPLTRVVWSRLVRRRLLFRYSSQLPPPPAHMQLDASARTLAHANAYVQVSVLPCIAGWTGWRT